MFFERVESACKGRVTGELRVLGPVAQLVRAHA